MLKNILTILQLAVPVLLVTSVLIQQRGTALGSAFGGGGDVYLKRRGLEKKLFWLTIVLGALFLIVSFLNLII